MTEESRQAVYVISIFSEIVGVHPQTIRHYEKMGLLEPTRTESGRRRFSKDDLKQLYHIKDLLAEGCSLASIKKILELEKDIQQLKDQLARNESNNPQNNKKAPKYE